MTLKRHVLAGLAAGGLLISQSAMAAPLPTRAGADLGQAEELAGVPPGAGPVIGLVMLLAVVFGIMAITDDDDDDRFPVSP